MGIQGKVHDFMRLCPGSFIPLSVADELPVFNSDLQAAKFLLMSLRNIVFFSAHGEVDFISNITLLSYVTSKTTESDRSSWKSILMLPGLDLCKHGDLNFLKSVGLFLGFGFSCYQDLTTGICDFRDLARLPNLGHSDDFFSFKPRHEREAGIGHCVGPDFTISKAWFDTQKAKEAKERGVLFNPKQPWYQRPDARELLNSDVKKNKKIMVPQIQLGFAINYKLLLQDGLAILPEPGAIFWSPLGEKTVHYKDRVIDLPEANCAHIVRILIAEDSRMGSVPIYYSGLSKAASSAAFLTFFGLPISGRFVTYSERMYKKDVDSFLPYYIGYAGKSLTPVHFDGVHTHMQFWALVNSPGLSSHPDFLQGNMSYLSKEGFLLSQKGLEPGVVMLMHYGPDYAKDKGLLDIPRTTEVPACRSICATRVAVSEIPSAVRGTREIKKMNFATLMADAFMIDWEAENKKSQREQLMSRVRPS